MMNGFLAALGLGVLACLLLLIMQNMSSQSSISVSICGAPDLRPSTQVLLFKTDHLCLLLKIDDGSKARRVTRPVVFRKARAMSLEDPVTALSKRYAQGKCKADKSQPGGGCTRGGDRYHAHRSRTCPRQDIESEKWNHAAIRVRLSRRALQTTQCRRVLGKHQ